MRRALLVLGVLAATGAPQVRAQAVPETAQARQLHLSMRRWPQMGVDPFRHVFWPRWGLVVHTGVMGGNNTLNAEDVGALIFLGDRDSLLIGDLVDAFGLVPDGRGVRGMAAGEGGAYLGGPFGGSLSLGVSAQGRGYGTFHVDDDAVRLFRDGNLVNQSFLVGETGGTALATADGGVHALINAGPLGTPDGPRVTFGFGGRYLRPLFYARGALTESDSIAITNSSIAASVTVDTWLPVDDVVESGSGIAGDFLVRFAWPTSGFAVEAMLANVGKVTIDDLEHERFSFNVNTTSLQELNDSLDAADFTLVGIESREVTLPRIVRFAATGWANRILQLDVAATLPVSADETGGGGEFEQALLIELGSTWRLVNQLPLRAGLVLGGHQGIGYTGGFGMETQNLLFRVTGGSLGGLFRSAKGAAGRFELGFFF